ncbi:hypothetical protein [Actinopolyspora saharensis]|uniref:Uncharacterized protein n=1 Tax=Actinopolyspora saharensis TaxID=995062 RepID=A0A1H1GH24_9ACTN|nr:hypothetical protein [Actinopolyspora saharensis]SDR12363.1 hypothetical protein SAMN04489718_3640 [Actinopolyspora saharensis]
MSFIDDLYHTVDRACGHIVDPIARKLAHRADGSDVDPTSPQDTVGTSISEDTMDQYAEQVLTDNREEFKEAIKKHLAEKLSTNSGVTQNAVSEN